MDIAIAKARFLRGEMSIGKRFVLWCARHRRVLEAWLILTPILSYYSFFFIFPVVSTFFVSFTRWSGTFEKPKWVGLANYRVWLSQYPYPLTIFNTALFAFSILLIQATVGLLIAMLLNEKIIGQGVHRTIWYIPTLTSSAIMAQLLYVFIAPYGGVFNAILEALGHPIVIWFQSAFWMRTFVIMFSIWRGVGVPTVLFLSALQGIHPGLYEAAEIDGASGWQLFRYITIPLLRPMITFVLITGIIRGFQIFETVMLITAGGQTSVMGSGGPYYTTNVIMLQIFKDAFCNMRLGKGSAGAVLLGIFLLAFSVMNLRYMRRGME